VERESEVHEVDDAVQDVQNARGKHYVSLIGYMPPRLNHYGTRSNEQHSSRQYDCQHLEHRDHNPTLICQHLQEKFAFNRDESKKDS